MWQELKGVFFFIELILKFDFFHIVTDTPGF